MKNLKAPCEGMRNNAALTHVPQNEASMFYMFFPLDLSLKFKYNPPLFMPSWGELNSKNGSRYTTVTQKEQSEMSKLSSFVCPL
jgi:hypothetical protein